MIWTRRVRQFDLVGAIVLLGVLVAPAPLPVRGAPPQLTLTVSEVPVGDQGAAASGALELSSDGDVFQVTISASDLTSAQDVIPALAITFDPSTIDVTAGSSYTAAIFVQIPQGQPVGTYTGTVTATDGTVQSQVPLTVVVNNRPVLVVPGPQTVTAGDTLSFGISATDPDGDPIALATKFLPDGAEFVDHGNGMGTFTFRTEPAAAGLTVSLVFFAFNRADDGVPPQDAREVSISVTAPGPEDTRRRITDLIALVRSFNLKHGIENSLIVKLQHARDSVNAGKTTTACNRLNAFLNEIRAQSGKALTMNQANQLIAGVNQIMMVLRCVSRDRHPDDGQ